MTEASFRSAGYAPTVEGNPDQIFIQNGKSMRLWHSNQNFCPLRNSERPSNRKIFSAIHMVFLELAHNLWETTMPTIVPKNNKFVKLFCKRKQLRRRPRTLLTVSCNSTSKELTLPPPSIQQFSFSPD